MGLKDSVSRKVKSNFDLRSWVGEDNIRKSAYAIRDMYKDLYPKTAEAKTASTETFEECMHRYGITEEGLVKRMGTMLLMLKVYGALAALLFFYIIFLFMDGKVGTGIFACILLVVLGSFMFKEHFNYFQMKQRRLGCTFNDWLKFLAGRK